MPTDVSPMPALGAKQKRQSEFGVVVLGSLALCLAALVLVLVSPSYCAALALVGQY